METNLDQKLGEAYAAGRRAGIAEMLSGGVINDQGTMPLVGTGSWLSVLRPLSSDMHQRSDRPCPTCRPISLLMGEPFGYYAYQAKRNLKTDLHLPASTDNIAGQTAAPNTSQPKS